MGRQEAIARSIVRAVLGSAKNQSQSPLTYILTLFWSLFSFYQLPLHKIRPAVFSDLRQKNWELNDEDYISAFQAEGGAGTKQEDALTSIGDMGFSGSSFYSTSNQQYLAKSVPRHSEHSFFRDDLLEPYAAHMAANPKSLLVRICDFLACPTICMGRILRLAPSHHIVMDNIMYGREQAKKQGKADWEDWDLKPTSYFYPERDIADGRLTSEATKDQLADEFHEKIILSKEQADEFFAALEEDTRMLAHYNAVDYSLFLVRIKTDDPPQEVADPQTSAAQETDVVPRAPPSVPPGPPSWRAGMPSPDGKHIYRAAILDFFWAKHKVQPRLMTFLISAWNLLVSRQGHMSITTTPDEYRERFLKMCREYVEVRD